MFFKHRAAEPTTDETSASMPENFVGDRVNVLVAEDSLTQALMLQQILEGRGYHVQSARNGQEALDYLQELRNDSSRWATFRPTLVLSDIVMPHVDGCELCHRIKLDDNFKNIPVILLTSLTNPKEALRGLYSGADNLISKPYEPSFLLARIDDLLATLQISADDPDKMFTLSMDGQKYTVSDERLRTINSVFTTYETAIRKNLQLEEAQRIIRAQNEQLQEAQRLIERQSAELAEFRAIN
jgi:CheY-like chemotaxis protein